MITKNIIRKYEKFWLNTNNNRRNSKDLNSTSILYSIFINSNVRSLCESLLSDEDRRIMNDISIDEIMEMILNNNNEEDAFESLQYAHENG